MRMSWITCLVLSLSGANVPALAAPLLEPCRNASYIEAATLSATGTVPDELSLKPVPTNSMGYKRGVSRRIDGNTTIWRCQVELADGVELKEGQPEHAFLIQRDSGPLLELPDDLMAGAFNNFDVINVNLDQSPAREHVLAVWNGQSNGMGIHRWTIFVFDARWNLAQRFDEVTDWGPSNLVAAPRGRSGCDIAITSVESVSPSGSVLVMRVNLYRARELSARVSGPELTLEVASDRPSLERRYNRAFEAQRTAWFARSDSQGRDLQGKGWQWRGNIAAWLNNAATKVRPFSP